MSSDRVLGYGRYADDPSHIGCPRASSDMTPCVARDGRSADQDGVCVGCGVSSADALAELVRHVTDEDGPQIGELEALRVAGELQQEVDRLRSLLPTWYVNPDVASDIQIITVQYALNASMFSSARDAEILVKSLMKWMEYQFTESLRSILPGLQQAAAGDE